MERSGHGTVVGGEEGAARPTRPPARSGTIEIRVRYVECDPMGLAHHASYLPWLEMGRTELLRSSGLSYAELEASDHLLVVAKLELRYKRPARYDDVLVLSTRVVGGSRVKIEHEYELHKLGQHLGMNGPGQGEAELILTAKSTLACVGRDGQLKALPEWLVASA